MRRLRRALTALLLLLLPILAACAPQDRVVVDRTGVPIPTRIGIVEAPTPTETLAATLTPLPVDPLYDPLSQTQTVIAAGPTPTLVPATPFPSITPPPPIPTGTLAGGILGLIPSGQGLWAMRGDGSSLTLITTDPIDRLAVSPNGRLAAYVTHINPGTRFEQPYGYLLKLITLYDGRIYPVASLDPPGLNADSPREALEAAANAIAAYDRGALVWSPGGTYLAFTSSHEAAPGQPASSDVYLYAPTTGRVTRLTTLQLSEGAVHAYDLQWSRDTNYIYFAAAYSFSYNDAPTRNAGAWIASLGGTIARVDDAGRPPEVLSLGENLVAWLPGATVLITSRTPTCPEGNLRAVEFARANATTLWPGCYADMVYSRSRDEVLISVSPPEALAGGVETGLYRVRRATAQSERISDQWFEKLYGGDSQAAWYGYQPGTGLVAIRADGGLEPLYTGAPYDGSTGEVFAPVDRLGPSQWLWESQAAGTVLLASPGQPPTPILDRRPSGLTASPTIPGLYFFIAMAENGPALYGVRSGDWQPFLIDDRLREPQSIIWNR